MNLGNFDQHINPTILDRGYNYFLNDRADDPQEGKQGIWRTKVHGTHPYHVEIAIDAENRDEIKHWSCDCPYDYGPVCKHVVAVLYMIDGDEKSSMVKPDSKKGTSRADKKQQIFEETTRKDLQEFIKNCFTTIDGFENRFLAYFAEWLDEESDQKYRTIINNYIKAAKGPHGFIDYQSARTLTQPLWNLNGKADELLYSGDIRECLVICQVLIEEVAEIIGKMDDSGGGAGGAIEAAFGTLADLTEKAPPVVRDELFKWCSQEMPLQKYHDFGFEQDFLFLLPSLVTTPAQEEQFFALLDRQIDYAKEKQFSDYSLIRLVKAKINYLQYNDREDEAFVLLKKNIQYFYFRMQLVEHVLDEDDFEQAKKLCKGGIEEAEKKSHRGNRTRWKEKLYQISEMEGDTTSKRERAKELFLDGYRMEWYKALKETYSNDKWPDVCAKVINQIKRPKQRGGVRVLANIFVEEDYSDRLVKLLQLNDNRFSFIVQYAEYISDEYPDEVLALYEKGIKDYAQQTGRKRYRQIADWLGDMKKTSGGDERSHALFKWLLLNYNNRPAMKDELTKAFPQWKGKGASL